MRVVRRVVIAVAAFVILPATVFAQTTLSGFVKDTSGAVLPGVSVEASSPVLIEKVRTGISDSTGLYRIPDLPPGVYKVTFTLPGFATVSREGVEVTGGGVTTINADMRVGALTETITVTGESPIVDTQTSTRRQMVLASSVVQAIPASRGYGNLLATVPGIQATGLDVSSGVSTNFFTARGGRGNEGTIQIDGMNVGSAFNGGGVAGFGYPIGEASEIQVTISGGLGEVVGVALEGLVFRFGILVGDALVAADGDERPEDCVVGGAGAVEEAAGRVAALVGEGQQEVLGGDKFVFETSRFAERAF